MNRELGKVYVTGSDGFIGSHLVEELLTRGHQVTALCVYNSNGHYGWLEKYAIDCPKNLSLILGDVRDPFFLESTIKGHDTVFHLASLIAIPYSYQAPQSYFETNSIGAINIAQACQKNAVGRLIHTSTSEVYGPAKFVPITEKHPIQGQSPYSASKISADMVIESYFKSFDLPAVTLRPFNTYGPRQSLRAVIPTVIGQMLAGSNEIKLGSLTPTRDFNYVDDTVAAFLAVGETINENVLGKVFNAGSEREISIGDLVAMVARLLKKEVKISSEDERIRPANSEVERLLADSTRLKELTSWKPETNLEQGLTNVISWLKDSDFIKRSIQYHR